MKKIVYKYKISKFKRFTSGLLFAIISTIALTLCLTDIPQPSASQAEIILPFMIAIISMFLGLFSMFRDGEVRKEKI
ncbi:MAG: hypothetical protein K0S01_2584 [Herbinix sp.]|jgi:uncharacterized membrane protein YtjA (UPF0391 family)|nr:hypothetical protein [Herbinix sp.]